MAQAAKRTRRRRQVDIVHGGVPGGSMTESLGEPDKFDACCHEGQFRLRDAGRPLADESKVNPSWPAA
jgi:hypothetical protein